MHRAGSYDIQIPTGRGQGYDHILERINFGFKNFACSRYEVSDDNDIMNIVIFHGRNKTNVDSHQFSFNQSNIDGLDLYLFDNGIVGPNVRDRCGNTRFFNASICNDGYADGNQREIDHNTCYH